MATTKDFREYVLGQLSILENITCRSMMGEYLLYYDGILFGGLYDNRLLVKIVEANHKYNLTEEIPYQGAKPMYGVAELENKEYLRNLVLDTSRSLPRKK